MKRLLPLLWLFAVCLSCNRQKVIYIQPLGKLTIADIRLVKSTVEKFYHYPCIINPQGRLTDDLLSDSKIRYDANRILSKYDTGSRVLILTDHDIVTANPQRHVKEWGIMGLGLLPGNVCVVSIFRIKRNVPDELFHQRLIKICLHELGHNFGLPHCSSGDTQCLMHDAEGKIKQVDGEQVFLCTRCRKKLCNSSDICSVN